MDKNLAILFDLDGTLTDPFLGITRSVEYSLKNFNISVRSLEDLTPFIGPPLKDSFQKYYQMDEKTSEQAIAKYREYFAKRGLYENEVYDGIEDLLKKLISQDAKCYICSSKPTVFCEKILEHFSLKKYFYNIYGSELDGNRTKKEEVISYCIEKEMIDKKHCVMVGDREHDVIGAHKNGIPCIGVLYGYGSREEFERTGCEHIVSTIDELIECLDKSV